MHKRTPIEVRFSLNKQLFIWIWLGVLCGLVIGMPSKRSPSFVIFLLVLFFAILLFVLKVNNKLSFKGVEDLYVNTVSLGIIISSAVFIATLTFFIPVSLSYILLALWILYVLFGCYVMIVNRKSILDK